MNMERGALWWIWLSWNHDYSITYNSIEEIWSIDCDNKLEVEFFPESKEDLLNVIRIFSYIDKEWNKEDMNKAEVEVKLQNYEDIPF